MFEIIIYALIALRLNFDIKSSLWEKFDAESSVNAEELMSLNMSNDLSSVEDILILNLKQIIMYILLFSESETSETSYFSEVDIMKFLHWFHRLEKCHEIINMKLIEMLSDYYECEKHSYIRA